MRDNTLIGLKKIYEDACKNIQKNLTSFTINSLLWLVYPIHSALTIIISNKDQLKITTLLNVFVKSIDVQNQFNQKTRPIKHWFSLEININLDLKRHHINFRLQCTSSIFLSTQISADPSILSNNLGHVLCARDLLRLIRMCIRWIRWW